MHVLSLGIEQCLFFTLSLSRSFSLILLFISLSFHYLHKAPFGTFMSLHKKFFKSQNPPCCFFSFFILLCSFWTLYFYSIYICEQITKDLQRFLSFSVLSLSLPLPFPLFLSQVCLQTYNKIWWRKSLYLVLSLYYVYNVLFLYLYL